MIKPPETQARRMVRMRSMLEGMRNKLQQELKMCEEINDIQGIYFWKAQITFVNQWINGVKFVRGQV